jgi:hypothetical protein
MWYVYLIALLRSAGTMLGGDKGNILVEVADTADALEGASTDVKTKAAPWIQWANEITSAKRDATQEEIAASRSFRDAVRQQNHLLATGTAEADLPPLPVPPGYNADGTKIAAT